MIIRQSVQTMTSSSMTSTMPLLLDLLHAHGLSRAHLVAADQHVTAAGAVVGPLAAIVACIAQLPPVWWNRARGSHRQAQLAILPVDADLGERHALLALGMLVFHPRWHPARLRLGKG